MKWLIASPLITIFSVIPAEGITAPVLMRPEEAASGLIKAQGSTRQDQSPPTSAPANRRSPSRSQHDTGICLSLQIDPSIWRPSAEMDPREQFSGIFLTYFDLAYRKAKAADRVASGSDIRIVADPYRRAPQCRDRSRAIYIDARYTVASDGGVLFKYRLQGRHSNKSSREIRVLDPSWQERSARAAQWNPVIMELTRDIERRSRDILDEIRATRRP